MPQPQACSQSSSNSLCCTQLPPPWLQVLAESCKAAAENGGTAKTPQDIMMSYARSFMTSPVFKASKNRCAFAQPCALGLHPSPPQAWRGLYCLCRAAASKKPPTPFALMPCGPALVTPPL